MQFIEIYYFEYGKEYKLQLLKRIHIGFISWIFCYFIVIANDYETFVCMNMSIYQNKHHYFLD